MLNKLQDLPMISTDLPLYRDFNLIIEQNKVVFEAVQELLLHESEKFYIV